MAVRSQGVPRDVAHGVAGLDATARALPVNMPLSRAAVLQAVRAALVTAGGSVQAFLAANGDANATDGSWEAVNVRDAAPPGGQLAQLLTAYLVGLGQTQAAAAASVAAAYTTAAGIAP